MVLQQRGHDVVWIRSTAPGGLDSDVLARANTEHRIVITFDKDFGELVFRAGLPASSGTVLFRFARQSPVLVARKIVEVLESRDDWLGNLAVVEEQRVRIRPLPS